MICKRLKRAIFNRINHRATGGSAPVIPPDVTPDPFSFSDVTDVTRNSVITSNAISIVGIDALTAVSISGGEYQVNGGAWTSLEDLVAPDSVITVRHTSSSNFSFTTETVLTVGGVSASFKSTTIARDTTPDAFEFTAQSGAALGSVVHSNTITVSGVNDPAPVTVLNGTVSIDGGPETSTGTVSNGQTVRATVTTSSSYTDSVTASVDIGGVVGTFTVTTMADPGAADPENVAVPLDPVGGDTVIVVTNKTQLDAAITTALTRMGTATDRPQKIQIAGKIADWFPSNKVFPSQLTIVPQDPNNPLHTFSRVGMGGFENVVIDGMNHIYKPASDTFPPVFQLSGCKNVTIRNHKFNLAGFDVDGVTPKDKTLGRGRAIALLGGEDVTFYRAQVPSAGGGDNNYMVYVQHANSSAVPSLRPRFIECAIENGKGGDGFRILGVQDGYWARNYVHNLTKNSVNDHCDAMQITQDGNVVPNSLTCLDHLHWGSDGTHRFEGFQITNFTVPNGKMVVRRLKTIGGEVSGLTIYSSSFSEVEACELYHIDYGVVGAQAPQIKLNNSNNVKLIGTNKAAGGVSRGNCTFDQDDGVSSASMLIDTTARDVIVNTWKTGVGANVPYL